MASPADMPQCISYLVLEEMPALVVSSLGNIIAAQLVVKRLIRLVQPLDHTVDHTKCGFVLKDAEAATTEIFVDNLVVDLARVQLARLEWMVPLLFGFPQMGQHLFQAREALERSDMLHDGCNMQTGRDDGSFYCSLAVNWPISIAWSVLVPSGAVTSGDAAVIYLLCARRNAIMYVCYSIRTVPSVLPSEDTGCRPFPPLARFGRESAAFVLASRLPVAWVGLHVRPRTAKDA